MTSLEFAASFDERFSPIAPFLLYMLVWGIVFLETGILVAFWLPGDSILFSAGLVAAARDDMNIVILVAGIFLAAFVGDQVGYVTGRKLGRPYLENSKKPRVERMVARSEVFYQKHGWWAVCAARFFPWFRTFIPPIAGISKMPYYKFLSANAVGALAWGVGITIAGYFSASIPIVKTFSYAIAAFFIGGSILSIIWRRSRSN
ncbi:MAG: DedA family protein [Actinobacteria bacterium]|nr:DedA family protein [Actinomycetota bacterium]